MGNTGHLSRYQAACSLAFTTHTYTHMRSQKTYIHTYTYARTRIHKYAYKYTYTYTYTYKYTYTYTYTHTRTHVHTYTQAWTQVHRSIICANGNLTNSTASMAQTLHMRSGELKNSSISLCCSCSKGGLLPSVNLRTWSVTVPNDVASWHFSRRNAHTSEHA